MTKNEINRVLHTYMEYAINPCPMSEDYMFFDFTESLDMLVPVWKKLRPDFGNWVLLDRLASRVEKLGENDFTIQWAAAVATAKAIKEMNDV